MFKLSMHIPYQHGIHSLSVIILEKLTSYVENHIVDYQYGFRKNLSTVEQILINVNGKMLEI